jgi:hypothetical protein
MGFNAELLILYPERGVPREGHMLWKARETIPFGDVTRLEKLKRFREDYSEQRAGICVVSWIISKLAAKLRRGPQWQDFAPSFLIYEHPKGKEIA